MGGIDRICLLGFGEVGSTLAADLLSATDVELTAWDPLFVESSSRPNQLFAALGETPRLHRAASAETAVKRCDLVVSAVTAAQAVTAAASIAAGISTLPWYVDLNSVAPGTKREVGRLVEAAGARYVEAAVMSPIFPKRSASPILLAGPYAEEFLPLARALGFNGMSVFSLVPGQAAATKMCRSVIVKGFEALVTEAFLAARCHGVEQEVLQSLDNLFPHPDWRNHARYMISRSIIHGVRRAEEMREVVLTLSEVGVPPLMSQACVERQQWAGSLGIAGEPADLGLLLDELIAHLHYLHGSET